jgi:hypothetical protein
LGKQDTISSNKAPMSKPTTPNNSQNNQIPNNQRTKITPAIPLTPFSTVLKEWV